MGHWIKYYMDGSRYVGDDVSIQRKERSWTLSRNDSIVSVSLEHQNMNLQLSGVGEYWQSDTFEAIVGASTRPKMVKRRIEKRIEAEDCIILISKGATMLSAKLLNSNTIFSSCSQERKMLYMDDHHIGQWFILEIDLLTKELRYYINPERI